MSNPVVDWVIQQPSFNTIQDDFEPSIAVDSQGNSYVAYRTRGDVSGQTASGLSDIAVMKIDTNSNVLWTIQQPTFNTPTSDFEPSIAVDSQGNSYIAYTTLGDVSGQTNSGLNDIAVMKLDTNSNVLWTIQQPTFNTTADDFEPSIAVDSQGNSYVAYTTGGDVSGQTNSGLRDIAIMKLDTNSNVLWTIQQPTFNTPEFDSEPSIAVDSQGNSYIAYSTEGDVSGQTASGSFDIAVMKLDTNSNVLWTKQQPTFNTPQFDFEPSIAVDSQGNSYIAYTTFGDVSGQTNSGLRDIAVMKLDTNSNVLWTKQQPTFNTTADDFQPSIAVDSQGNSYVAYRTGGQVSGQTASGLSDIAIMKLDTNSNVLWTLQQPTFNTPETDIEPYIAVDSQGNSYIAYTTRGQVNGQTASGQNDIAVLKLIQKNASQVKKVVHYKKYFVVDTSCQKSKYIMNNSLYQFYKYIVECNSNKRFSNY
jgi:hypothetical protein